MPTHHPDPLLRLADSAVINLHLEPPIDLYAVCKHLRIRVHRKAIADSNICGFYVVTPKGRRVIRVNTLQIPTRQRYTLAHEICHHLLIGPNPEPGTVCELRAKYQGRKPAVERRCDKFAAALLMPHWIFREWWNDLAGNPTGRVPVLASRFGASNTAIAARARELRLAEWRDAGDYRG